VIGTFWRRVANCVASGMQLWKAANQSYPPNPWPWPPRYPQGMRVEYSERAAFGPPFLLVAESFSELTVWRVVELDGMAARRGGAASGRRVPKPSG
jgi:hypothetical protein